MRKKIFYFHLGGKVESKTSADHTITRLQSFFRWKEGGKQVERGGK